jgi:hypothetical protein
VRFLQILATDDTFTVLAIIIGVNPCPSAHRFAASEFHRTRSTSIYATILFLGLYFLRAFYLTALDTRYSSRLSPKAEGNPVENRCGCRCRVASITLPKKRAGV